MHIFKNTNFNFLRWRWHAIALLLGDHHRGRRHDLDEGDREGGRVRRRHGGHRAVRTARDRPAGAGGARAELRPGPDHQRVRRSVAAADDDSRAAGRGRIGRSAQFDGRSRSKRPSASANLGGFKRLGTEIVGPAVGAELTNKAHLGDGPVAGRHPGLHLLPLSAELRGRGRRRHHPRPGS